MSISRADSAGLAEADREHLLDRGVGITSLVAGATARPRAGLGRQPEPIAGRQLRVVPNPIGRNAHAPLPILATTYREAAVAAGIVPYA
jgi:TDG/mug DNA glycosylase family protein